MTRLLTAIALAVLTVPLSAQEPAKKPPAEVTIDALLGDDSVVKLTILDAAIEFQTPHGKLVIPANEIRKIDLGLRIPEEVLSAIKTAAADLGSAQFRKREDAMVTLLKHREKSYPTLKEAAASTDAEVAKRAEELIAKLQELVSEARLNLPEHDVIHTAQSKIAGKIVPQVLRAKSFAFGDVTLKLADVQAMSVDGFKPKEEVVDALPNPGSLTAYQQPQHIGKTFTFKVTGAVGGSIWGTEMYTLDSSLAAAAVHMGIVKVGQTGNVKVMILGPSQGFVGSTRNGVTTSPYDSYPGAYKILKK